MNFKKVFRGYDPEQVDKYIEDTAAKEQQIRVAQKERIDELSDENYSLRQQVKQYQTDEQAISKSLIASQHLAEELKNDAKRYSDLVLSRAKIFYATWSTYAKTLIASLSEEEVRAFNALQKKIEDIINAYEGKDVASEFRDGVAAAQSQPQPAAENADQAHGDEQPASENKPEVEPKVEPKEEPKSEPKAQPKEEVAQETPGVESERPATPSENGDSSPESEEERWRQARAVVDVTPSEATMRMRSNPNPIARVEEASGQVIDLRELTQTDMSLEDLCAELGLIVKKD